MVVGAMFAAHAAANPVPPDDLSLLKGADLFGEHCTECHGWDPLDQYTELYVPDEEGTGIDFDELIDIAQGTEPEEEIEVPEDWPDWAQLPDPGSQANETSVRAEILEELTRAIDDAYGTEEQELDEEFAVEDPFASEELAVDEHDPPMEGATDVTNPDAFFFGTSEQELYNSIANGVGVGMPGWLGKLPGDNDIWDLVNYIRSLWGEDWLD